MLNSFTFIPIQNERKESYKEYRECVTHNNGRGFRFLEKVFSVLSSKACVGCVCVCGGVGFSLHISPHSWIKVLVRLGAIAHSTNAESAYTIAAETHSLNEASEIFLTAKHM